MNNLKNIICGILIALLCSACGTKNDSDLHSGVYIGTHNDDMTSQNPVSIKFTLANGRTFDTNVSKKELENHLDQSIEAIIPMKPLKLKVGGEYPLKTASGTFFTLSRPKSGRLTGQIPGSDKQYVAKRQFLNPKEMLLSIYEDGTNTSSPTIINIIGLLERDAKKITAQFALLTFATLANNEANHSEPTSTQMGDSMDCPDTAPGTENTNDGWCKQQFFNHCDENGNEMDCYRGYDPPYEHHQCCYNPENGDLVSTGSGAGSWDEHGPACGELASGNCKNTIYDTFCHWKADVLPLWWFRWFSHEGNPESSPL